MGVNLHHNMRCLMKLEIFVSLLLFGASIYVFFMVVYFNIKSRKILPLVFGLLGTLILLLGIIASHAISIWKHLNKQDGNLSENIKRRVRFSSFVEILNESCQSTDESNESLDHEYVKSRQKNIQAENSVDKEHNSEREESTDLLPGLPLELVHDSDMTSTLKLYPPLTGDELTSQNENQKRSFEVSKMHLNIGSLYGTFEESNSISSQDSAEELEHDDEEEIII